MITSKLIADIFTGRDCAHQRSAWAEWNPWLSGYSDLFAMFAEQYVKSV